ncbi:hypothetical protein K402DRAFT_395098 [Aulographum hederae CBS 113979]|uniref:Uncharacterized protein n=1 Tax=Aulographum hederae CBS 113979 TaxID=1176131 RepID=A0A6G1GW60_9PEZI|nr:hypothetical protein K402DRAFT_395098 [Aulographum hederae CBS 113979]
MRRSRPMRLLELACTVNYIVLGASWTQQKNVPKGHAKAGLMFEAEVPTQLHLEFRIMACDLRFQRLTPNG